MSTVAEGLRCAGCGDTARRLFAVGDLNRSTTNTEFTYYRCGRCGLVFLYPVPADLGRHYPSDYYMRPESLGRLSNIASKQRYEIDLVKRFRSSGSLLEVGPAYGAFAYLAREAGFDVSVIEMDADCCRFLAEEVKVNVVESSDPAAALERMESKDVIVLWQVIEHLPDPWAFLDAACRRLAPGGILLVAAPNPDSLQFRLFGSRWVHLDAPRHLQLIPITLLTAHLAERGLRRELTTSTDRGGILWDLFGWRRSAGNLAQGRLQRRMLTLLGTAASPILLLGDIALGGATYTAVFRKESA
jgi:2-polyprenyl-3-methyl-5-hydroxy-6-metoxy-1,4-benzoquinol methylase